MSKVSCEAGIGHRFEYEEEEGSWRERDQMAAQWEEEQKLDEIVEQRRIEGDSLKLEVMRKALELVVHERMSHGVGVRGLQEKNTVPGSSAEEMKEKPITEKGEDAAELRKWRYVNQILEEFG